MVKHLQKPSRARITAIALRVLEGALAEARHGPVKRSAGQRLALAWLAHEGIGLGWHYPQFWETMAISAEGSMTADQMCYIRITQLTGLLGYWYSDLGIKEPDLLQRAKWAREVGPLKGMPEGPAKI